MALVPRTAGACVRVCSTFVHLTGAVVPDSKRPTANEPLLPVTGRESGLCYLFISF